MKLPIYLDYAATTPVDSRVVKKMLKYLTLDGYFGNPASKSHYYGWQAEEAVNLARNQIAKLIGIDSCDIIFTSGATEANNLAIKGIVEFYCLKKQCHIITTIIEHSSVLDTCKYLERCKNIRVTRLFPRKDGIISVHDLNDAFRDETILISVMHVNNEIGVIQNIKDIGDLCRCRNILFHVDATQSIGKLPIDLANLPIDLMSFSAHKLYGPKGIGCLYLRKDLMDIIQPQIHGGGHERSIRSGTLPVHQIVGMGEACCILRKEMITEMARLRMLRDYLWKGLQKIDGIKLNGNFLHNVGNILNISFFGIDDGSILIAALKNLAISSGAACISAKSEPSYVLQALGLSKDLVSSAIRLSFGRFTTKEEIDYAIVQIKNVVTSLREINNLNVFM